MPVEVRSSEGLGRSSFIGMSAHELEVVDASCQRQHVERGVSGHAKQNIHCAATLVFDSIGAVKKQEDEAPFHDTHLAKAGHVGLPQS